MTTRQSTACCSHPIYSCAPIKQTVVDGEWVIRSKATGYDYSSMTLSDDLSEQTHQAFENTKVALGEAGAGLEDIVRIQYYISDMDDFQKVIPVLSQYIGKAKLTVTAFIKQMTEPKMKIEMEVTASRSRWSHAGS